jgi:hypothetical protein
MGTWIVCMLAVSAGAQATREHFRAVNRTLSHERGGAWRLDPAPGDGAAWLLGKGFSTGHLSVEVQGADLEGRSFVGIAFHRASDQKFEAVYLRPFNFNAADPAKRAHSVQYVSMPDYPWQTLRASHPGEYEAALAAPAAADAWIHLVLEITEREVRVFVNDGAKPVLSVARLGDIASGDVGLWVGNESGGRFRNLVIEP